MLLRTRLAIGAILLAVAINAQAIDVAAHMVCGSGKITEVIEGAWSREGFHLSIDWDGATPPGVPSNRFDTVRVLATDHSEEFMRVLRGAAWLAFVNDFTVKFITGRDTVSGDPDCSRITEIHLSK